MKTTRLRATLRDVEPPVERVIDVPASATLPELHNVLQAAFGWWDYHLHEFVTADERCFGIPDDDAPEDQIDEGTATLGDLGNRFTYHYDFGDDWTHDVQVIGPGGDEPGCIGGQGASPPEDCGGPGGFADLLATLADPSDEDHEHMREWMGNRLRPFDREHVDGYVKRMVGEVPATVRLLLDLVGDGVRLTPGGRLPRVLVREFQQHYPSWHPLSTPAATEDDLPPLGELHALLRHAGLLRLRNGTLAKTKAAADAAQVVRRLRGTFDPHAFATTLIETTATLLAVHGPLASRELGRALLPELGQGWSVDGKPVTAEDVVDAVHQCSSVMKALDLADASYPVWSAGRSARSLLPGATLRAEVWSVDMAAGSPS